jgi:hypothetical protein
MCFGDRRIQLARARVRHPEPWPWPPLDQLGARDLIVDGVHLGFEPLVEALETQYVALSPPVRALWLRIWCELDNARSPSVAAPDLHEALGALSFDDAGWNNTRNRMGKLTGFVDVSW